MPCKPSSPKVTSPMTPPKAAALAGCAIGTFHRECYAHTTSFFLENAKACLFLLFAIINKLKNFSQGKGEPGFPISSPIVERFVSHLVQFPMFRFAAAQLQGLSTPPYTTLNHKYSSTYPTFFCTHILSHSW